MVIKCDNCGQDYFLIKDYKYLIIFSALGFILLVVSLVLLGQ